MRDPARPLRASRKLMRSLRCSIAIFASMLFVCPNPVAGQQKPPQDPDASQKQALFALEDLAREAKEYDDVLLKARIRSRVADLIWKFEPDLARTLIFDAFGDAANLKDDAIGRYTLRNEIIDIARRHDRALASDLIGRLASSETAGDVMSRESAEHITERGAIYLDSARGLLGDGDQAGAVAAAEKSLSEGRSNTLLWLLTELKQSDPRAADKLFLSAVAAVRQESMDPNDVLHLGSYLFAPGRTSVSSIDDQIVVGYGVSFNSNPPPPLALLLPYLQAAAVVLERSSTPPNQPRTPGSVYLKRYALQQLLPLFDRYVTGKAAMFHAELSFLSSPAAGASTPALKVERAAPSIDYSSTTEIIASIERIADARERDQAFFDAAQRSMAGNDLERAQALASRISQTDSKDALLEVADFMAASRAIRRKDLAEAEGIANSKLNPERQAIIYYTLAMKWTESGDPIRANALIDYAWSRAAKVNDRNQRVRVYLYLASGIAGRDILRAFEIIESAVKDLNSLDKFDAADDRMKFELRSPAGGTKSYSYGSGIGLLSVVKQLARADLNRTMSLVRSLRSPAPRGFALLEACRVGLTGDKNVKENQKTPAP